MKIEDLIQIWKDRIAYINEDNLDVKTYQICIQELENINRIIK